MNRYEPGQVWVDPEEEEFFVVVRIVEGPRPEDEYATHSVQYLSDDGTLKFFSWSPTGDEGANSAMAERSKRFL